MPECLFCSIVAGDVPAHKVYEDEVCLAFLDIQPINPGHTLVVPREHSSGLEELPPVTAGYMINVAQRVAGALRGSELDCEGVNLLLADGEAAGQEVGHVHLHVVPRHREDGFGYQFPPGYSDKPDQDELAKAADSVREALESG